MFQGGGAGLECGVSEGALPRGQVAVVVDGRAVAPVEALDLRALRKLVQEEGDELSCLGMLEGAKPLSVPVATQCQLGGRPDELSFVALKDHHLAL